MSAKKQAPGTFAVVDDIIHYTTKRGIALEIDLDFPADVIQKALKGDGDDDEQFSAVKEWLGDDFEAAFEQMGALERTRFVRTFFAEWEKAAGLPLGESLSSSSS